MKDRTLLRLERLRLRASRTVRARLGLKQTVYVNERLEEYRGYWEEGARSLGASFTPLTREVWEVRAGARVLRLSNHITPFDDHATRVLAGDKPYCYRLAREVGVPVPDHVVFEVSDLVTAHRFFEAHPAPFVLKPAKDTASGMGITTGLSTWPMVVRAIALASFYGRTLMLERMVAGESCRLLYLGGELIHAVRRRGVRVTGDGQSILAGLLEASGLAHLAEDDNTRFTLAASGRSLSDVPRAGEEVLVRGLPADTAERCELRTVYDEDVTSLCAPALAAELSAVVRALGSEFAGIDIIANDLGRRLGESGGTFLEINTTPGIHHHYVAPRPAEPVAKLVLAHLLEGHRNGRS
jgi:cyanophycin synthetase